MGPTSKHVKPRVRRRKLRLALLLLGLAPILAVIVVQAILWTDIPRRVVVTQLERALGAHVELGDLDVGWFRRTTAHNLSIRRPLDDDAFLVAPRVEVTHASLPRLLLGGGLAIEADDVETPRITVVEDERGAWNVIETLASLARSAGANGPAAPASFTLPRVAITGAEVVIVPQGRPPVTLPGLRLTGTPDGTVAWGFAVVIGEMLEIDGRLALDATMAQHVELRGDGLEGVIAALGVSGVTDAVAIHATWDGARTGAGLDGYLTVQRASLGDARASGRLEVILERGSARMDGLDLLVDVPARGISDLHVRGGAIVATGARLDATRVVIETSGVRALIDGHWNPGARDGAATVTWEGAVPQWSAEGQGRIDVSVAAPSVGPASVTAAARAAGRRADAAFGMDIALAATGADWRTLAGHVTINEAHWRDETRVIRTADLRAALAADWPVIRLDEVEGPEVDASVRAVYDTDSEEWSIVGAIDDYPVIVGDETVPVSLTIDARGDHEGAVVEQLFASTAHGTARVEGRLDPGADNAFDAAIDVTGALTSLDEALPGAVQVRGRVRGSISPPAARFSGTVETPEMVFADGTIPALALPVELTIDERYDVSWTTDAVTLFGGTLRTEGTLAGDDADEAIVGIEFETLGVDLTRCGDAVPVAAGTTGSATVRGRIDIPVATPSAFRVTAAWQIEDVTARSTAIGAGTGRVEASRERVDITEIDVGHGEARVTGHAFVDPSARAVSAKLTAQRWPVEVVADAIAYVDADVDAGIDLGTNRGHGTLRGSIDVVRAGAHFAAVDAEATLTDGTVEVKTMTARLWDGTVEASGAVPIDDWTDARGAITWSGLRIAAMGVDAPGRLSGQAVVEPAPGPRPLEPLLIRGSYEPDGMRVGLTDIGVGDFVVYLGPQRAILQGSTVAFAGGTIESWARATWRDGQPLVFLDARFQGLEAAGLAGMMNKTPVDMPGRVDGTVSGGGPLNDVDRLFGNATLTIADSDLLEVGAVSALYDVLNLRIGKREATGRGRLEMRLEGRAVNVRKAEYFNHGTDITARLRIDNVWMGAASPITGTALGAIRPLKDFDLPVFRNIDRGMRAFQTNTGGVRLTGTLGEPSITPVPVPELGAALRAALQD